MSRSQASIDKRNATRRKRYQEDPEYRAKRLSQDRSARRFKMFVPGHRSTLTREQQLDRLTRIQQTDMLGRLLHWPRVGNLHASPLTYDVVARSPEWDDPTFDAVCERMGL